MLYCYYRLYLAVLLIFYQHSDQCLQVLIVTRFCNDFAYHWPVSTVFPDRGRIQNLKFNDIIYSHMYVIEHYSKYLRNDKKLLRSVESPQQLSKWPLHFDVDSQFQAP